MKKRTKINFSSCLKDLQPIGINFFGDDCPNTTKGLASNQSYQTAQDLKSPRHCIINNYQENGLKITSLERAPFEESSSSVQSNNQQDQIIQEKESGNIANIVAKLPSVLKTTSKNKKIDQRKKKPQLKQVIKRQKINNICTKFAEKIHRNNVKAPVVDFQGFQIPRKELFLYNQGFQVNKVADNIIAFLSIIQVVCLFFAYTLALVFQQVQSTSFIGNLQYISIPFYLLEIVYNCLTIKANAGKKLVTYAEILLYYLKTHMIIDFTSLLFLLIDCTYNFAEMQYFRLFIIAKLPQCLQKMQKLQAFFIKNYYNEQYWSLIKVVLFNFCFAHILAIALSSMTNINEASNWQIKRGINDSPWFQRYIWSYYWGTTIMLTIGFGDIVATTYEEALCLIIIEIFSVMCLAYNINSVGTLISNIRSQDVEKSKNYKTFKHLSDKYELTNELQWKINHYIEESVNIRKKFNLEEENSFLEKLPPDLKKDYLKQSNRSIFEHLPFFGSLIDRTLYAFAEHIEMSISHPQQTLRRLDDDYNLLILRQGEIGFTSKKRNCNFNDMIIDRVKVTDVKRPFLLGLQFLTRKRPIYQIKSLEYSVIYYLKYDDFIKNLKESQMDYHHFCFLRDKNKAIIDQFEVYQCEYCPGHRHTKFSCPKLHYIPLKQLIIFKQQQKQKKFKNIRRYQPENRISINKFNALFNFKIINRIAREENSKQKEDEKTQNPFLEQLDQLKKIRFQASKYEQSASISTVPQKTQFFIKYTSEVIKQEFNRFRISQNFEDQVWSVNCDKMKSYKDYFPENNHFILEQKFNLQKRLRKNEENKKPTQIIHGKSTKFIMSFTKPQKSMNSLRFGYSQQF